MSLKSDENDEKEKKPFFTPTVNLLIFYGIVIAVAALLLYSIYLEEASLIPIGSYGNFTPVAVSPPRPFSVFLSDHWLFVAAIFLLLLTATVIVKPRWIINTLRSKIFWLLCSLPIIYLALNAQAESLAFLSAYWLVLAMSVAILASLFAVWKLPLWLTSPLETKRDKKLSEFEKEEKRIKLIDDSRKTVATIIGGLFVVVGAIFTYSNYQLAYEGQVTNRFSTAVSLLKEEDVSVRLGGIFALERVAKDSPKDHSTVMEILAAYVREQSKLNVSQFKAKKAEKLKIKPDDVSMDEEFYSEYSSTYYGPVDIVTAIGVILRRKTENDKGDFVFDLQVATLQDAKLENASLPHSILTDAVLSNSILTRANLFDVDFTRAYLSGADMSGAELSKGNFFQAHLAGTNLESAILRYATLTEGNLRGARLLDANLENANLNDANLQNALLVRSNFSDAILFDADLSEANLEEIKLAGARLGGVNLTDVIGLTFEQLSEAIIDERTKLPQDLIDRRDELLKTSQENLKKLNELEKIGKLPEN